MLVRGRRPKSALASHAAFATNPQATLQDGLQGGLVYVDVPYLNGRTTSHLGYALARSLGAASPPVYSESCRNYSVLFSVGEYRGCGGSIP